MIDVDKVRDELGDWPIIVSATRVQFYMICKALQLNPHRTTNACNLRSLEGARPTAVVYGPGWQGGRDWMRLSEMLDRLMIVSRVRPPVFYLDEDDLP